MPAPPAARAAADNYQCYQWSFAGEAYGYDSLQYLEALVNSKQQEGSAESVLLRMDFRSFTHSLELFERSAVDRPDLFQRFFDRPFAAHADGSPHRKESWVRARLTRRK
jgi:hypothetical protein